jgi:tetratricopeptide (TPR) repeat protein
MIDLTMKTSVMAALRQGDMARATELALDALKNGQQDALYLNLRAQLFELHGRNREAMADLEAAHALEPRNTGVLEALGLLRLRLVQPVGARDAFERIVAIAPDYAHGHFCLGLAHEALGELDRATACFKRADALEPGRSETLARIAALGARKGEWDEARRYATQALERNPREFDAKFVLAAASLDAGNPAAVTEQLRTLLNDGTVPPAARANAASLIADAFDAQGDADAAFSGYAHAAALFVEANAPQFANRASAFDQVTNLRDEFNAARRNPIPAVALGSTNGEAAHVFLIGFPRSGTTLLEAILAAHPRVVATEERDHLGDTSSILEGPDVIAKFGRMSEVDIARFRRAYWDSVRACGVDVRGKVFLDKLPLNTIKLPLIRRLFPSAKIVFALRDPRDVVFSCYRRRFALTPAMYELLTLEGTARFYGAVMELFEIYLKKLTLDVHYVRHEGVIQDLESETRRLCSFIGLDWVDGMRAFAETARVAATPSGLQVKKGLYDTATGHWKKYETHLAPMLPLLAPWVQRWRYDKTA